MYTRFVLKLAKWGTLVMTAGSVALFVITVYGMAMHYPWNGTPVGLIFLLFLMMFFLAAHIGVRYLIKWLQRQ